MLNIILNRNILIIIDVIFVIRGLSYILMLSYGI